MSITDSKAWRKNTGGELAQMFSLILRFNKYKGLSSVNTQNNSACFMSTLDHAMRLRYKNSVQNAILEDTQRRLESCFIVSSGECNF